MLDKLYKLKKNELQYICAKNSLHYNQRETKRQLAEKIHQNGGRMYKCMDGKNVKYIKSSNNPQNNPTKKYSGPEWICKETNLGKEGCTLGVQPGKLCKPCWQKYPKNRPKECRGCLSGENVFYCV